MPVPTQGVGNLIVNDLLTDVAFSLFQPCVNVTVPTGGIAVGPQTVLVWDASLYVDAQIVVGANTANIEVVTMTAVVVGTSFSATFTKTHAAGLDNRCNVSSSGYGWRSILVAVSDVAVSFKRAQ